MDEKPVDIKSIFGEALEKETAEQRAAYLDKACGNDDNLRNKVEALLKAYEQASDVPDAPIISPELTLDNSPPTEGPGTKIGRYKLLQLIGEGGFGMVYMAEQKKPISRRVALKIIKLGMDTKQVIARFEVERQALAMMEHPNIAKVLDAGATKTGRPYFVMELVRGISITEYCDKNNLDTQQRLELFIEVCKAVQHAHQKGIIHRDIKPTNVMITRRDGTPVPKIIDFGIAKATQRRLTEKTLFTEYHQFIGTPEYMSPEQAEMGELDVDTRSDIYSLGVLLYELLTGTTPFERKKLLSSAYDEMLKTIREGEPPKPSTRLNTLGDELTEVARHRHAEPGELCKIIRGDLDWVVMKALEKDRTRRYETPNELATDIERHLRDEPVVAGPPSNIYRLRKFIRRNRTAVSVGLVILLTLMIGFSLAVIGFVRASCERSRAQTNFQKAREAVDEMTRVAEKQLVNVPGTEQIRRDLLQKAQIFYQEFVEEEISNDPAVRQEMGRAYKRLADIHQMLGQVEQAEQAFRQAVALFEALSSEFPSVPEYRRDLGVALFWLSVLLKNNIQDKQEALKMYRRSFDLRAELVDEFPTVPEYLSELAHCHVDLGLVLSDLGRHEEALAELRQGLDLRAQLASRFPDMFEYREALAHSHHWLGSRLMDLEQFEEAEKHLRQCLTLRKSQAAEFPDSAKCQHDLAHIHNYMGNLLLQTGQTEEAVEHLRIAAGVGEELVANFPKFCDYWKRLSKSYERLGDAMDEAGRREELEATLRQYLSITERMASDFPDYPISQVFLCRSRFKLGFFLQSENRFSEAEQMYRPAIALFKEIITNFPRVACYRSGLFDGLVAFNELLSETGRPEQALESCREMVEVFEKLVADFPLFPQYRKSLADSYRRLGDVLKKMGRSEEAQQAYYKAQELENEVATEKIDDSNE
jgi:serine/threonine protein kinase